MMEHKGFLIALTDSELNRCRNFAYESANSQQRIEFGNSQTEERSIERIIRNTADGKMGEVAVVKFLREKYGLHLPVNYEVYPRGEWDDEDIVVNGRTIDVKTTRGHNLIVEKSKMVFRLKQGKVPSVIVACRIKEECKVDIVGAISAWRMVRPDGEKIMFLRKGELIPGTNCKMKTDNYVVDFKNLCDIKTAFDYILKEDAG